LLIFKDAIKKVAITYPLFLPVVDISLLTLGIAFSGGETSPYYVFYSLFIVFVSMTYGLKHSLVFTIICISSYVVTILIVNGNISGDVFLKLFFFLALSILTGTLEVKIHKHTYYLAVHDSLTSLYNYQYFYDSLEHLLEESFKASRPVSLAVIDVDDFKRFNDKYGHLEGDRVLTVLASIIKPFVRANDIAARYGGDELVIIFPNTGHFTALKICQRLKEKIALDLSEVFKENVTISIGISTYPDDGSTSKELFESADKALYKAKRAGKDTIALCNGE
jgi:diguanylate cyclase (GGDEF)-like protein